MSKKKQIKGILTVKEAAEYLGITRHTVRYHIIRGHLPIVRTAPYMLSAEDVAASTPASPGPKPKES